MSFRTLSKNNSQCLQKSHKELSILNLNKTSVQNPNHTDKILDLQSISNLSKYYSNKTSVFKKIGSEKSLSNLYSLNNPIIYNSIKKDIINDYYTINNDNNNSKLGLILPITKKIIYHSSSTNKTSLNYRDANTKNGKLKLSPLKTYENYNFCIHNKKYKKKEIGNYLNTKDKKKQISEIDLRILLNDNPIMNFDYFYPNLKCIRPSILMTNNIIQKKPLNINFDIFSPKSEIPKNKKINKINLIPIAYKSNKEINFYMENTYNEKSNFADTFRRISNSIDKYSKHWKLLINGKKSKSQNKGKMSNKDLIKKYKTQHINDIGNEIGKLETGYKNVQNELDKCFSKAKEILEEYMIQNDKEKKEESKN